MSKAERLTARGLAGIESEENGLDAEFNQRLAEVETAVGDFAAFIEHASNPSPQGRE